MKTVFSRLFCLLALFSLLFTQGAYAGQATLMWDPPAISTDVAGYVVDYGTASGSYTQGVNVGNTTSYTVGNLPDGQIYYFAVAAYNSSGALSDYSNEVSKATEIPQYSLTIQKAGTGTGAVSGGGSAAAPHAVPFTNPVQRPHFWRQRIPDLPLPVGRGAGAAEPAHVQPQSMQQPRS